MVVKLKQLEVIVVATIFVFLLVWPTAVRANTCPLPTPTVGSNISVNPGDSSGNSDSANAWNTELSNGKDIELTSGSYLLNNTVVVPSNRRIFCTTSGVALKQTVKKSSVRMFELGPGTFGQSFYGCHFQGPNYNAGTAISAGNYDQPMIWINGASNVQIYNNDFNGEWGYTGAIELLGPGNLNNNVVTACNTFENCGYYAEQLGAGTNDVFHDNTLTNCAAWVEAANSNSVVTNAVAYNNSLTFTTGVGCRYTGNCASSNYLTCGESESGNAFNNSSNYCYNNSISGNPPHGAFIHICNVGGNTDTAQYCGNTIANGATVYGYQQWKSPCPSSYPGNSHLGCTGPTSPTSINPSDVNGDGKVDIIDIGIIIDNYGKTPIPNPKADINSDGKVDIIDIGILIDNYGK